MDLNLLLVLIGINCSGAFMYVRWYVYISKVFVKNPTKSREPKTAFYWKCRVTGG